MSYAPTIDFLALLRQTAGGVRDARMPGLDYILAALARAGMFQLWTGQTAPTVNQSTTAWLLPSLPSWVAEGTVLLWNVLTNAYEPATPALWNALLLGNSGYVFQSVAAGAGAVAAPTSMLAIQRAAPAATALTLPSIASRGGRALQIVDFSTGVVNHVITVNPAAGATIMQLGAWALLSTADQLAGITLYPSSDLNAWVIAP